ncbi:hypothetical protein SUDANB121_02301 [Nocardiopsis dassonvillei]|uniref:hypothetical protein n=1 Tax=Nocardiopsis dassonvillei TaxID=2014 RepID=UPI003F572807
MFFGFQKGDMGPIQQEEHIREIAASLAGGLPVDWESATYDAQIVGGYINERLEVEFEGGEKRLAEMPDDSGLKASRLRSGMYKQGRGTWFSVRLELWSSGKYKCRFNYAEKPAFGFAPDVRDYEQDLKIFPRDEENIPGWMKEILEGEG